MKFLDTNKPLILFFIITICKLKINGEVIQQDVDSEQSLTLKIDIIESFMKSFNSRYLKHSEQKLQPYAVEILEKFDKQDFRINLKYLKDFSSNVFNCETLNSTCHQEHQTQNYRDILDPSSHYRRILSSLVKTYIAPTGTFPKWWEKTFFYFARSLLEMKEANYYRCQTSESLQMKLNSLCGFLMSIMMQNYAMVSYTYQKKYLQLRSTNKTEAKILYSEMQELLKNIKIDCYLIKERTSVEMFRATTDIRRCDPYNIHEKDKTYDRLTYFIQGWVGSEKFLNSTRNCGGNCSFNKTIFYKPLDSAHNNHQENGNQSHLHLHKKSFAFEGTFYNCSIAPQFDTIYQEIQPAEPERLYHHLSLKKQNHEMINFGQSSPPYNGSLAKFSVKDFEFTTASNRKGKLADPCKICLCYLDREFTPGAVRAINTNQVSVPPGSVVTGIRWVIKNQLVQLELRGHEFKDNFIVPSTGKWYDAMTSANDEYSDSNYVYLDANQRSLCLEDMILSEQMIVVGAKFVIINGLICLSIQGAQIINNEYMNYRWYSPLQQELKKREELRLFHPDASHRGMKIFDNENVLSMSGKHFVKFQPTDFLKDAAQTTVPYLDIQEVCTDPPTPLQGLGIYYKGKKGYGGFIALKIMTANVLNDRQLDNEFKIIDQYLNYDTFNRS